MIIDKGDIVEVNHKRKGKFTGLALETFDTETREFYPIATLVDVDGLTRLFQVDDEIPCRRTLCEITVLEKLKDARSK